jgi:hypothetical protein
VVCLCGLTLAARLILRHWRTSHADEHLRCAKCSYIILPNSPATCPECGNNVRITGLVGKCTPPPLKTGSLYLLIVLLAMGAAVLLTNLAAAHQPFGWRFYVARTIAPQLTSGSALTTRYIVQTTGSGRYFGRTLDPIAIFPLDGSSPTSLMSVWADSLTLTHDVEGVAKAGTPFTHEVAERYCRRIGGSPEVAGEIEEALQDVAQKRFPTNSSALPSGQVFYTLTDGGIVGVACACFLLLAGGGSILLWRNGKRRQRWLGQMWRAEADRIGLISPEYAPPAAATAAGQE